MTHPYSIFIWHAPLGRDGEGYCEEPVQVAHQEYALYLANLIYKDTRSVIEVVRYGLTIASFPDEKTVQRVEQQIARVATPATLHAPTITCGIHLALQECAEYPHEASFEGRKGRIQFDKIFQMSF